MRRTVFAICAAAILVQGCVSSRPSRGEVRREQGQANLERVLEKQFLLDVIQYVYRWHYDQSFMLEPEKQDALEIWARAIHPNLDPGDRSEFVELWIPAVRTRVELKRSDYRVLELNLEVVDPSFKVKRVSRQPRPSAPKSQHRITRLPRTEVSDYLFNTRAQTAPVAEPVRQAIRGFVASYLSRAHPGGFTEKQIFYAAPSSPVCNDIWVFWETGRKVMLFSADMDLSHPGAGELSQLHLEVIDLDRDVVTAASEVPGSNAFVTKDWVGRLFYNCILFGNRLERTPEEMNEFLRNPKSQP